MLYKLKLRETDRGQLVREYYEDVSSDSPPKIGDDYGKLSCVNTKVIVSGVMPYGRKTINRRKENERNIS